ncbi:MAG TPA: hypothetical protein VES38_02480 [Methylotenera sp.]|nr:hypothetical protein [Methylotenera sp.]
MIDRKSILNESKKLGLPARGKSELLARKISIIKSDPKLWTREDFEIIMSHLSIDQDLSQVGWVLEPTSKNICPTLKHCTTWG